MTVLLAILLSFASLSAFPNPLQIFKCVGCERDEDGKIKRSKAKARAFLKAVGWKLPTADIRVDHIIALACGPANGGYDDLGNMQLQWKADAAAKDRWERDKRACAPATQAGFLMQHGQSMPNQHSRTTPASWVLLQAADMHREYLERRAK